MDLTSMRKFATGSSVWALELRVHGGAVSRVLVGNLERSPKFADGMRAKREMAHQIVDSAGSLGLKTKEAIGDFLSSFKEFVGNEIGAIGDIGKVVDSANSIANSSVRIVSREGNIVEIAGQGARGTIEMMAEMTKEGERLILKGAHIQGAGPGTSSFGELIGMARELGKSEGVKEVVIEGARRTTGAAVGKMPRQFTVKVE